MADHYSFARRAAFPVPRAPQDAAPLHMVARATHMGHEILKTGSNVSTLLWSNIPLCMPVDTQQARIQIPTTKCGSAA